MPSACGFFPPPLMYRLEVCLVSLYMLRLCVGVRMKTERQLSPGPLASAAAAAGEQANECLKQTQGRKEGGQVLGEGKTHPCTVEDGPGRRLYALVLLLLGLCKCIVSKLLLHV